MNLCIVETGKIKDSILFYKNSFFDQRGENAEGYNKKEFNKIIKQYTNLDEFDFNVDSFSFSKKNVLRGFHGDKKNHKLIQVLYGEVFFVIIDTRKESPTYKKVFIQKLSEKNRLQVLVPAGCVNAHLVLSERCIFHYKLSLEYTKIEDQIHVKWNDKEYNIKWPVKNPILSQRDQ